MNPHPVPVQISTLAARLRQAGRSLVRLLGLRPAEVYAIVDHFGALYAFEDKRDRDAYAAMFAGAHLAAVPVMSRAEAAAHLAATCPRCLFTRSGCLCEP